MVSEDRTDNLGVVRSVKIEEEMRQSYLDYAMSVIVSRALPDVRDGLKPVQRRILYAMDELALRPGQPYKKSARIVGEVLGKYHPHGDSPVYDAMVRLAQPFSMRYPLVDGQGNFGSVDGDPPAAMRYTEARLAAIATDMLADIEKNTVDFEPNFDDSLTQPTVLPARLPNLLVNGASGIAVGMATNIPPHNLREIASAIAMLIDSPDATVSELAEVVLAPDFPTRAVIYTSRDDILSMYGSGRGRVIMRARAAVHESTRSNRLQLIVTEIPYQVNKSTLIERIADLVRNKRVEGISDLRDESDRHGMRIVIELKREAQPMSVLNALYKHTAMQSSFAMNMLALVNGQPRVVNLKEALEAFIDHRREVIRRRSEFDLEKARERAHILEGLLKAIDMLDAVIATIRGSESAEKAKEALQAAPFEFTERQAQAILDMQLRRLAALERQKLQDEFEELIKTINYLEDLLANPRKMDYLIRDEARDIAEKHGDDRRTEVKYEAVGDFNEEDLVAHGDTVIAITQRGYIKRGPLDAYRLQKKGGKGATGMSTREEDAVLQLNVADTKDNLLFFTDRGRVFQLKAYEVEDTSRRARGLPVINLIQIEQNESVTAVVNLRSFGHDYMVLVTRKGEVKKTPLKAFEAVRRSGLIAMDLEADDVLIAAKMAGDADDIVIVSDNGKAIRFTVGTLRSASRTSGGVRGMSLPGGARVVAADVVAPDHELLVISTNGMGKRTLADEYPRKGRGGQGVISMAVNDKTGPVSAAKMVKPEHELLVISEQGIVMRTRLDMIRKTGRNAQGVHIINVNKGDRVSAIAAIDLSTSVARFESSEMDKAMKLAADNGSDGGVEITDGANHAQNGDDGDEPGANGSGQGRLSL
ncbi:MAG: DNA gyrase subunit A [Dehalococcoidia bacterium]|nr:DNA gyrase subunit A [Dehalococcoidia bacterium]